MIAISHVGGMPSLLDAVDIARGQGAKVVALTRPGTALASRADFLLGLSVPDDAVMHVGIGGAIERAHRGKAQGGVADQ